MLLNKIPMGRFDVLTQLDKKPSPVSPPVEEATRKPENLKTRTQEKAEKYSTQLQPSVIKKIKQYALEHDVKDYEVIHEAVTYYLDKKNGFENPKS
jgi:hypothetical protein